MQHVKAETAMVAGTLKVTRRVVVGLQAEVVIALKANYGLLKSDRSGWATPLEQRSDLSMGRIRLPECVLTIL